MREMHSEHGRRIMEEASADSIARDIAIENERGAAIGN